MLSEPAKIPDPPPAAPQARPIALEPAAPDEFRRPQPAVRSVWMLSAVVSAGVLGLGALLLDLVWLQALQAWPFSAGVAALLLFLVILSLGLVMAHFRYRSWQYALRENVMLVHYGVLWRMRRCIPRSRIQHVDIESGPIDRAFGLVKLSIFTAGTITAVATIPGLSPHEAEQLRERLITAGRANV